MKKIFLLLTTILVFNYSCDDLEDYNVDPKNPETVDAEYLFTYGQYRLVWQFNEMSYNFNVGIFWANYATQTTYFNESNYDSVDRDIAGSIWDNIYTRALAELTAAEEQLEAEEPSAALLPIRDNKLAIISILKTFSYQYLVDTFGYIPYTEALDVTNVTPAYDSGEFVYTSIIADLQNAIAMIDTSADSFGDADLIYGGDMTLWKKFAYSLQLKLGTRLSDYDSATASTLISEAYTEAFTSNDDIPYLAWTGTQPYVNPTYDYFVIDSRNSDFVAADNFVTLLEDYNDPRLEVYFDDNLGTGVYLGGEYGAAGNAYAELTHLNPDWTDDSTRPSSLLEYSTVCFEIAEAIERGFISGSAEDYYNAGVTASFEENGLTTAEATAYLLVNPYDSTNWQESIGMQKYISLFYNGHEAWTEARRTGVPELLDAASSGNANPTRMIYPINESQINTTSYNAAVSALGGDTGYETIFWDVD